MRNKEYYSPEETITDQYTIGKEYMTQDRIEYIGLYHRYLTGEVYTQPVFSKQSRKLIKYKEESNSSKLYRKNKSKLKTKFQTPVEHRIQITNEDIKNKSITRNILKNVSSKKLIEISDDTVKLYNKQKIDKNLYQLIKIKWVIAGPLNTTTLNNVVEIGAVEQNIREVEIKSKKMPELLKYFTSFSEFYTDDTYIIPTNINTSSNSNSNISANSTSLY